MTVKEAFAQAFDEAFVMDALPSMGLGSKDPNPAASGIQKNPAKALSMGGASSLGATTSGDMMTLAEHDEKNHPGGYKGGKCTWRDSHGMSGMTLEEAQRKGLADKKFPAQGGEDLESGQGDIQEPTPEMIDQNVKQISENLQMTDTVRNDLLPNGPEVIETEGGKVEVQDVVQKGIVEGVNTQLQDAKESGDVKKEQAATETLETLSSVSEPLADNSKGSQGAEHQTREDVGQKEQASTQPAPAQTITTSDGKSSRNIEPDEAMVLAANPEKKEILQRMVDIEGMVEDFEDNSPEFKDLANQYQALQRMFFGDEGMSDVSSESSASEEVKETPLESESPTSPSPPADGSGEGGGGGEGGDGSEPPSETPPTTPPSETPPTTPPNKNKGGAPAHQGTPTPSDSEFQVGKNKYKVGGTVYTDVSGKGLLRTMLSSFMAGLRGEGIITGWDRISGAWDQMKRSENGEMVRDGISGALIQNTIANYAAKEGLSDDAKMELSVIQDMISQAKSPKDNMAAVKQFQAWKEKYSKELGELDKPKLGEPFKPLPNDYKGGKPPISILDPPKDFDADKAFGNHVAAVLQESLGAQGLPVGDIESISVGPSATTIEFKVDPSFDITAANSKKVKESLKGALGTPVSKIEYAAGKPHVVAVQVTNLKMRDVSFSSCIASDEWKDFADKAGLPVTLGKDSSGKNVNLDLAKQPHTIVTGESGSGKSVFLMAAINSLEMAKTPDEARLVLLDPKNEFRSQDGSPHLLYPRAQKPQDIANVVSSLKALMDDRIAKIGGAVKDFDPTKNEFQGNSDRNITEYNKLHPEEKMPHVLMTFDEVASIMKNPEVSDRVKQDLSQIMALGRSVGINCLLATQRADVASIPGDIKANAPASIAFKAAPDDAKASAAAKSLAGSGDFIMTDKGGKQTRGRGCFISDKEVAAVPAYYRDNMKGAPTPTDGGGDSGGGEGPQLPQEHLDAISAAVEKGNPISMVAAEGYMDAFKNAFPSDWEITEEEIDGETHWKASPPSKPNEGEDTPAPEESGEETPAAEELKEENTDWRKDGSRDDAIATLSKVRDAAKAKAWDTYNQGEDTADAQKKLQKALEKADSDFNTKMALVDMKFPPPEDESMDGDSPEGEGEEGESPTPEENGDDDEDSPAATMKDIEETFNAERERIEKALSKPNTKVRDKQKFREERKALKKRFNEAKAKFEAGGSAEDMLNIFEPEEEKPAGEGGTKTQETTTEPSDEDKAEAAQQEQAQKDEKLRSTVREQKFYGAPGFKATSKVTPQQVKQMENLLPAGWEFVTDNQFKAPARTKNGVVFIRHPSNGSYGRIFIKTDEKGKEYIESEAQIDVDTTHPDYQGFVKNEDGTYGLTEEGKKAEAEYKHVRKYSKNEKERAEVQKKFNRIRFGHDEAPDNMTIVANAVANVLEKL